MSSGLNRIVLVVKFMISSLTGSIIFTSSSTATGFRNETLPLALLKACS